MKNLIPIVTVLVAVLLFPCSSPSEYEEILCCRPVCSGCGNSQDFLCDYQSPSACSNLDGWKVEDCSDCSYFNRGR